MTRFLYGVAYCAITLPALAQNSIVPTRPFGDNSNAAASTAFVANALSKLAVYQASSFGVSASSVDNSTALNAAIIAVNTAGGGVLELPPGLINIGAQIILYPLVWLRGQGMNSTVLRLNNNINNNALSGLGSVALFGTTSSAGIYDWALLNITIDGNRANQTAGSGHCLSVYGYRYTLQNVTLKNCASEGIHSDWGGAGLPSIGIHMEAYWENVYVDTVSNTCINARGPHDTVMNGVFAVDCGQSGPSGDSGYNSMFFDTKMNARINAFHAWNTATTGKYSTHCFVDSAGGYGNTNISNSHFESCETLVDINTPGNTLDCSNSYYNVVGGRNIVIQSQLNFVCGTILAGTNSIGVTLGLGFGDNTSANKISMSMTNPTNGAVDFTYSTGNNRIDVTGYNASGTNYISFPNYTDDVDLSISGAGSGGSIHQHGAGANFVAGPVSSGLANGVTGQFVMNGFTSGTVTIQPQSAAGTYNFNLPTAAGASGQNLLSAGGASAAMTWATPAMLRYCAGGVNFNSANTDTPVQISPLPSSRYVINGVYISNASASISTATVGVFTATGGGGQTIAADQAITVTAAASNTNNNAMQLSITNTNSMAYNSSSLQVRVGTAQGSAATADVCIYARLI